MMQGIAQGIVGSLPKKVGLKCNRKSPPQQRRLQDGLGSDTKKDELSSGKFNPLRSTPGSKEVVLQKNVAWKICHTKPSTKRNVQTYFQLKGDIAEEIPLLEMLVIEAFMNMNPIVRSKIFASPNSQNTKWSQAKWYHSKGPVFSALSLFREWIKAGKCPLFCKSNCLNLGAMHSFLEQCQTQLYSLRSRCSHPNLASVIEDMSFSSNPEEADDIILNMLLESHGTNLHIYSGVSKIGYFSIREGKWVKINKWFGFACLGQTPKYCVVINNQRKSTVGVVWIDSTSAASALLSEQFNCTLHEAENQALLFTTNIENLGLETKKQALCELKKLISAPDVFFTTSPGHSGFSIHTTRCHVPEVVLNIALNIVKEIKHQLSNSNLIVEFPRYKIKNDIFVAVTNGLACENVSKSTMRPVLKQVSDCGTKLGEVRQKYPGAEMLTTYNDENEECQFLMCSEASQAEVYMKLNCFQALQKPYDFKSVGNLTQNDIKFVQPVTTTIHLRQQRPNQTTERTVAALLSLFAKFLGPNFAVETNVTVKEYRHKEENLVVGVETTRLCQRSFPLFNFLSSSTVNDKTITFADRNELEKQLSSIEVIVPSETFAVVASSLKRCLATVDSAKPNDWFKSIHKDTGMTHVFIKTSSRAVMQQTLQTIKAYATPETVHPNGMLEFLQSTKGRVFLQQLMTMTETYITYDIRKNCIQIFGCPHQRAHAKLELEESHPGFWHICKIGDSVRGLSTGTFLKEVVPKYEPLTKSLKGIDAICEISLGGSQIIYRTKRDCTISFAEILGLKLDGSAVVSQNSDTLSSVEPMEQQITECSSCLSVMPKAYVYTLEGCGHSYCKPCIELQVKTSIQNLVFPMLCAGCNVAVSLCDVSNFAKIVNTADAALLLGRSALKKIRQHPDLFLECPSGLCDGVVFLHQEEDGNKADYFCCKCKEAICFECKTLQHGDLSCQENRELLHSWRFADPENRKMCPHCRMGIQKNGGCNNVTCTTCKKHICWSCLAYFDVEDQCYRHLRQSHGGYN